MKYWAFNELSRTQTHSFGPPETSLQLVECQEENPSSEEAVIHVDAVGMHIADSLTARGTEKLKEVPCIPGFEGVGTVEKLGSEAKDLKEGDKVLLPMGTGSMTQQIKLPASSLTKVPEPYAPDEQLALITVNGFHCILSIKRLYETESRRLDYSECSKFKCGQIPNSTRERGRNKDLEYCEERIAFF